MQQSRNSGVAHSILANCRHNLVIEYSVSHHALGFFESNFRKASVYQQ